jgi:transposase
VLGPSSSPSPVASPLTASPTSGRGGQRPGAGRKPGSANLRTQNLLKLEKANKALSSNFTSPSPHRPRTRVEREEIKQRNGKKRERDWIQEKVEALKKRSGSKSGKIWTETDAVRYMQAALMLMSEFNLSTTAACEVVAEKYGVGAKNLHDKLNQYLHDGTIELATGATRGFASTPYYANLVELTSDHQARVEEKMGEWSKSGESVTKRMIQKFLKEEFNIEITMNRIAHYLLEWGCEYARVREIAPVDPTWHARRIGRFIVQYHRALKEEAEGIAVIVYTDESYIHSNHACQESWFPCRKRVPRPLDLKEAAAS